MKFRTRINDHVSAHTNNNPAKSAFTRHLLDDDHLGGEEVILHVEDSFCCTIALEAIEIERLGVELVKRTLLY